MKIRLLLFLFVPDCEILDDQEFLVCIEILRQRLNSAYPLLVF